MEKKTVQKKESEKKEIVSGSEEKVEESERIYGMDKLVYNEIQFERNIDSTGNCGICKPIDSLKQLYDTIKNPPAYTKQAVALTQRCSYVIKNTQNDCHVRESDYIPKQRIKKNTTPRTLICHDMQGGYILDKYVDGINQGNGFTFHRWAQSDIFCYFSHHFITVPPLSWINLAHLHENAVIGTVITEHKEGMLICAEIFQDDGEYKKFADGLVEICVIHKFDGWLLNIENSVLKPDMLLKFVQYLTQKIHQRIPGSYIIWYDSVIMDGRLRWQNELNEYNKCYFDVCDGIFLNYGWTELQMLRTKVMAGNRFLDVYVGIDVWGRGSYGGGQFNSYKAAKVIHDFKMSMAIFAHGWVHENNSKTPKHDFLKRYYSRSSLFWKLLWPYMYTTPINSFFSTFFKSGVTSTNYNLKLQDVQPSYSPAHAITKETITIDIAQDVCRCVQERLIFDDRFLLIGNEDLNDIDIVHPLFSTQINLTEKTRVDVYTYAYEHFNSDYEIILLAANSRNEVFKIVGTGNHYMSQPKDVWRITYDTNFSDEESSVIPKHWDHRRFILNYPGYELLEIGIKLLDGGYLYLCGFTIEEE